MDVDVASKDELGSEMYKALFIEIMSDIGRASHIERARITLDPEVPLFIFSLRMRSEPMDRTLPDVSSLREEGGSLYVTITDERHAPSILDQLWKRFGRDAVDQQTRFDVTVKGATEKMAEEIVIASGEETLGEIIGALWRTMPEGIKNRKTFSDGSVITVVATEEIMTQEMFNEGRMAHESMRGP